MKKPTPVASGPATPATAAPVTTVTPAVDKPANAGADPSKTAQPLPDIERSATIVGGDAVVGDGVFVPGEVLVPTDREPGEPTDNPADAPLKHDEERKGDDRDRLGLEVLVVTAAADRRRAGRRFRKGHTERIPLTLLEGDDREMIEADPLLSTRVERA